MRSRPCDKFVCGMKYKGSKIWVYSTEDRFPNVEWPLGLQYANSLSLYAYISPQHVN